MTVVEVGCPVEVEMVRGKNGDSGVVNEWRKQPIKGVIVGLFGFVYGSRVGAFSSRGLIGSFTGHDPESAVNWVNNRLHVNGILLHVV
ncbi:hypothetical protein HanIR_Chr02g0088451 [Helianthus annuus]|nr:hypothetical protein HanIR_Chr02g0088451 [Helianthus annuus]